MKTKLKSKKWKSLVSGILLAASASSFLIAPVFAAEYTDPLTGYSMMILISSETMAIR